LAPQHVQEALVRLVRPKDDIVVGRVEGARKLLGPRHDRVLLHAPDEQAGLLAGVFEGVLGVGLQLELVWKQS